MGNVKGHEARHVTVNEVTILSSCKTLFFIVWHVWALLFSDMPHSQISINALSRKTQNNFSMFSRRIIISNLYLIAFFDESLCFIVKNIAFLQQTLLKCEWFTVACVQNRCSVAKQKMIHNETGICGRNGSAKIRNMLDTMFKIHFCDYKQIAMYW